VVQDDAGAAAVALEPVVAAVVSISAHMTKELALLISKDTPVAVQRGVLAAIDTRPHKAMA
jgi:hypothetical protein